MTKEQIYDIWKPAESSWSAWVKPMLFSFLGEPELESPPRPVAKCEVPLSANTAIVADLPGAEGVRFGVALSRQGKVFLLDSNRRGPVNPEPGWFDNRSFVTSSDFPSGDYLTQRGITRLELVQTASKIQPDVLDVLLRWQSTGLAIYRQTLGELWKPHPVNLKRPWLVAYLWEALRRAGYHRGGLRFGELVIGSTASSV